MENLSIKHQCEKAVSELMEKANLKNGNILVVGCSTSEVIGSKIGTNSDPDVAKEIFDGIYYTAKEKGVFVAFQCCEHLNRAIVISKSALKDTDEIVNVIPQKKAGGSLATIAYSQIEDPVVVENIKAAAGIDIGGTLIGMHLKKVEEIGGVKVKATRDYSISKRILSTGEEEPLDIAPTNTMYFELEDGSFVCTRPSGTEPKLKLYYSIKGKTVRGTHMRFR